MAQKQANITSRRKYCCMSTHGSRKSSGPPGTSGSGTSNPNSTSGTPINPNSENPTSANATSFLVHDEQQSKIKKLRATRVKVKNVKSPKLKEFKHTTFRTKSMKRGSYKRSKGWFSDFLDWCLDRIGGCFGCEFEKNKTAAPQQSFQPQAQAQAPLDPAQQSPFLTQDLVA